jgi:hypothetical protein
MGGRPKKVAGFADGRLEVGRWEGKKGRRVEGQEDRRGGGEGGIRLSCRSFEAPGRAGRRMTELPVG